MPPLERHACEPRPEMRLGISRPQLDRPGRIVQGTLRLGRLEQHGRAIAEQHGAVGLPAAVRVNVSGWAHGIAQLTAAKTAAWCAPMQQCACTHGVLRSVGTSLNDSESVLCCKAAYVCSASV